MVFVYFLFCDFLFFLVWVRARPLSFRFLGFSAWFLASWRPWLLGFSVSGLLGHSTSYKFLVLYGLLASWFSLPSWLFGLSASWPLDFL